MFGLTTSYKTPMQQSALSRRFLGKIYTHCNRLVQKLHLQSEHTDIAQDLTSAKTSHHLHDKIYATQYTSYAPATTTVNIICSEIKPPFFLKT